MAHPQVDLRIPTTRRDAVLHRRVHTFTRPRNTAPVLATPYALKEGGQRLARRNWQLVSLEPATMAKVCAQVR